MKVREVAQRAAIPLGVSNFALAYHWVSDRFIELATDRKIKPLRKSYEIVIAANIDDGTVSITRGTNKITGNSAAQAEWDKYDLVGRFIRVDGTNVWLEIIGQSGDTLTVASEYAEETASASAYNIVQRLVTLPERLTGIFGIINQHQGFPLKRRNLQERLNRSPMRTQLDGGPIEWSEWGTDAEGKQQLEIYPYTTETRQIVVYGYKEVRPLKPMEEIPSWVEIAALVEGVKVNILEWKSQMAVDDNRLDAAGVLTNQKSRQETLWRDRKERMLLKLELTDDSTFILDSYGRQNSRPADVIHASDHVLLGWTPLTT